MSRHRRFLPQIYEGFTGGFKVRNFTTNKWELETEKVTELLWVVLGRLM